MRKLLIIIAVFVNSSVFAQFKSGLITYSLTPVANVSDSAKVALNSLMETSSFTYAFNKKKARFDLNLYATIMYSKVADMKKGNTLEMLRFIKGEGDFMSARNAELEALLDSVKCEVELVSGETKEIFGYTCNLASITNKVGTTKCWYSKEVQKKYRGGFKLLEMDIPGVPLEFTSEITGLKLNFVCTDVKERKKWDEQTFSTEIPEGYTVHNERPRKPREDMKPLPMEKK